jgi:hypothetical protein
MVDVVDLLTWQLRECGASLDDPENVWRTMSPRLPRYRPGFWFFVVIGLYLGMRFCCGSGPGLVLDKTIKIKAEKSVDLSDAAAFAAACGNVDDDGSTV